MSPIALGLSLFATLVSTLSYLGTPGEMVAHGPMMITQVAAHPLVFVIVGYGLIPLLMRQPVTSAYEILESRLGTSIRMAGAGVFLLLRFGWMATILFATSYVVLVPLLGIDAWWTPWLCVALGVLTAMYASWGGIKAVVTDRRDPIDHHARWRDRHAGGDHACGWAALAGGGPTSGPSNWQAPSWGFDPNVRVSFGILVLSTTLWYVCTNGSDQMSIQRFLSTRDAAAARRTLAVAQITDAAVALAVGAHRRGACWGTTARTRSCSADGQTITTGGDQLFPEVHHDADADGAGGLGRGRDSFGRDVQLVVGRQFDVRRAGPRFLIARR